MAEVLAYMPHPNKALLQAVAQRVKDARGSMSQADLAREAGIEISAIQRLEKARGNPTLSTLDGVTRALGRQISFLLSTRKI